MKKGTKKKKITNIDDLAVMVARGFSAVAEEFKDIREVMATKADLELLREELVSKEDMELLEYRLVGKIDGFTRRMDNELSHRLVLQKDVKNIKKKVGVDI